MFFYLDRDSFVEAELPVMIFFMAAGNIVDSSVFWGHAFDRTRALG